jgi:AmmeMemoRadiSam system protein A
MLTAEQRRALLALARRAVGSAAAGRAETPPPIPAGLDSPAGAFVSLHDAASALRGCIGFIEALRPLWLTVWHAAGESATGDTRFAAVTSAEVADLSIEISVLSAPRSARPEDIRIGVHGILLHKGPRRALLLPQVAADRGWGPEQFLGACAEKAGLPFRAWTNGATLEIFDAEVFHE